MSFATYRNIDCCRLLKNKLTVNIRICADVQSGLGLQCLHNPLSLFSHILTQLSFIWAWSLSLCNALTLSTLCKIFHQATNWNNFLIFLRKMVLTFHANCLQCAWVTLFLFMGGIQLATWIRHVLRLCECNIFFHPSIMKAA